MAKLDAPFPYFGGKSRVADLVWSRFGEVANYVEPFFGSGAILLGRPHEPRVETVNDADGFVSNFWRAVAADAEGVAREADWPVNECDLHARHLWLIGRRADLTERLMADPAWYDVRAAGWWVWGLCSWIGSGWCSGNGPWQAVDGRLSKGNAGRGINRQLPNLGNAGTGINRKLPHLGNAGTGILEHFTRLQERLRSVRVACGDWSRVCGDSVAGCHPSCKSGAVFCGVFMDPPYSGEAGRCNTLYSVESTTVAHDVREWCLTHGGIKHMRIALCGYEGEHEALESAGWDVVAWKAKGGYGSQGDAQGRDNSGRERIWFSPHCLGAAPDRQTSLF